MKKGLSCIFIVALCISLCSCGGNQESGQDDNSVESVYRELGYMPEDRVMDCFEVVELNMDNWSTYFGDYHKKQHIVEKNSFGEVTNEYDRIDMGFRPKDEYYCEMICKDVGFKFSGYYFCGPDYDCYNDIDLKAGIGRLYSLDGTLKEEYSLDQESNEGYLVVDLDKTGCEKTTSNRCYTGSECVDVTGIIFICKYPNLNDIRLEDRTIIFRIMEDGVVSDTDKLMEIYNKYK